MKTAAILLGATLSGAFSFFVPNTHAATAPFESSVAAYLGRPQLTMHPLYQDQRFPNITVTPQGTLLATWGSESIRVRRSEDGGETWGDAITIAEKGIHGGGTTVDENSGNILVFVEDQHPPAPLTIYRSQDEGRTWSAEKPSIHRDSRGNLPSMHMNEHGITLSKGKHAGRLVRAARYYGKRNNRDEWPTHYTNAVYSDDGGRTWHTSDPFPENGTGEAAIVELMSGQLYYNSRVHWQERPNNRRRRDARSHDAGKTWTDYRIVHSLPDGPQDTNYGCMGGLTRLRAEGHDILIYSNCDSPKGRHHGTVWASFDGGKTWPIKRLVYEGSFAYSSLIAGRPGTATEGWIYLHFEGGPEARATVAKFNLSWILGGSATGDGTVPKVSLR